ncbi:MAG: hypothetical protein M8872_03525 [marine benthic group bacterium]|nr:hypothetical protein [Gemmatimonadota bacterium]
MKGGKMRLRKKLLIGSVAVTAATAACGGGRAPVYVYSETDAPLSYHYATKGKQAVETPNGTSGSGFDTEAVLLLDLGSASPDGRTFSIEFEAFDATLEGQMGSREVDGASIRGLVFRGITGPAGSIQMVETPAVRAGAYDQNSLLAMFPDILAPLPPGGDASRGDWPHAWVLPTGGGLEGETSYTGTARFAGDTTWNGIEARLIVSEGAVHADGTGTPEGAPGEVALSASGSASATYVWDPASGVLLAMKAESRSEGSVLAMGFDLPIEIESERHAELVR